ncbi:putative protein-serine/threonine phosphatase [Helianthus annuus]|uniref:Uncharacterized protein n=1 Tax=Helianthus annuus TaxID=4232 RepID=A0A9K3EL90_HELAN|nr:putative protein-serine/threonine phosphatase [Helianthus annuus]
MYLNCEYSIGTCQVALYATAGARSDGMFLLCGGRDTSGVVGLSVYVYVL